MVEQTPHFALHMPPGSFAEQRAAEIGAQLEALAAAVIGLLDLPAGVLDAGRIHVYLGDMLPDPGGGAQPVSFGSWAIPERWEIWSVFRPDAPGIDLDRAVARLLVLRATGADLAAAPLIWTGIAALCAQQLGCLPPEPALSQALAAQGPGQAPAPSALWGGPRPGEEQTFFLTALSFLGFLLRRNGPAALQTFVVAAASATPDQAARAAYHISLRGLEITWWQGVRKSGAAGAGGIGRFLGGALRYLRPYWKQEIVIFLFLGVQLAFQQILPRAQALLIDRAILQRDLRYLLELALFLFGMVVLVLLAGVLNDLLTSRVSESVLRTLRDRMFVQLQRASHRFYNRIESADILSRFTNDLRSVEQGLTSTLTQGAFLMLSLAISTVHILLINWLLAVLVLLCLPLFFLATRFLGPRANRASLAFSQEQAAITGVLQEDIAAQPVIKAYNLQITMIERFRFQAQALYHAAVRLFFLSSLFGVTANLLTTAVQVGVLTLGSYFVIQGRLPLGNLIEFLALLSLVIGPVQSISGLIQSIQVATASMDRVEEILNLEPDVRDAPGAAELQPLRQAIRFEHVSFSYRGDQPQLQDVSLEIAAGQTVAFVGPSGSGKSTMVNLLMRFYDPDYGRILFDGQDIRQVTLDSLRRQIGSVFQESFLFNTSVRENIRFGREEATDADVEAAARQAEIDDVILELPQGYDTVTGERGAKLSGGQRQRLAIARAILRQPSLLVLDEATSSLDARTENAVNHTLASLAKGRTTITVTHRLAAAATADRIFVLDQGRLVEQGTHQELLDANGLYRRLYEEQGGGTEGSRRALEVAYLRGVPIFADTGRESLAQIAAFLRSEQVAAGETLVETGAEGDKLYLVVSGELDVLAPGVAEQERVLAKLSTGDYFGEVALLRDLRQTVTVRARTGAQLLSLDKETLGGLFETIPGLRNQIEAAIAARERAATPPDTAAIRNGRLVQPPSAAALELRDGLQARRLFRLNDTETGLGRNPGNDIVLTDPRVSGFHARIRRQPDGCFQITDSQSTNGTQINGRRLDRSVDLADGDTIQIGSATLVFHAAVPESALTSP